jgi:Xaa-Pro aminopeptidase
VECFVSDWVFPDEAMYRARVADVQGRLRAEGLEVLVASGADTRRWLGGVDGLASIRPIWLVVPAEGEPTFVSPRLETEEIQAQSWIPVRSEWLEWDDGLRTPRNHLEALRNGLALVLPSEPKRIGIDGYQSTSAAVQALREFYGADALVDATPLLMNAKLIRDAGVIDVVRRCADIAFHQYEAVKAALKPGMAEWELGLVSRSTAVARSAYWWDGNEDYSPLIPGVHIMSSGAAHGSRGHGVASGRIIQDGDLVEICFCGMPFFGHSVGFDRPLIAGGGKPRPEVRRVIDIAEEAQAAALAAVRPGNTAGEVHAAAFEVVKSNDLVGALRHRTGRGLGCAEMEYPELKAGDATPLQPGMVFAVEPGIYVKDVAGVRFGDTVLVTETGYEAFTPVEIGHDL